MTILNTQVWRPSQTSTTANLPVLVWIHGGAYTIGSVSDPAFDGTRIVTRSVAIGKPIILVTINYRVNTFGFLASSHVPLGDLDIGCKINGLLWSSSRIISSSLEEIQRRYAYAACVMTLFPMPPPDNDWWPVSRSRKRRGPYSIPSIASLFRAAIMDSSTGPFKSSPPPSTYDEPGKPFDVLLKATGYGNRQLLRQLRPVRASAKIALSDFVHVPVIAGTNLNEGTSFSTTLFGLGLSGSAEVTAFEQFVKASQIDGSKVVQDTLDEIVHAYPANTEQVPSAQATPSLTGRRLAAKLQPVFSYFFTEFVPGDSPKLGVFHASELRLLFGPVPAPSLELEFANTMLDFYITFVNDLNPGPSWPQYNPDTKQVLQLQRDNITSITDDFRQGFTNLLNTPEFLDEWEK
ncbi:Alpha/Beta hydrolase protein [Russula vinacea]|nr:Alpha/Beta hydrolase protein [Russula vinacea]